jgi:hypothetical protein
VPRDVLKMVAQSCGGGFDLPFSQRRSDLLPDFQIRFDQRASINGPTLTKDDRVVVNKKEQIR